MNIQADSVTSATKMTANMLSASLHEVWSFPNELAPVLHVTNVEPHRGKVLVRHFVPEGAIGSSFDADANGHGTPPSVPCSHSSPYRAGFILVDPDETPCVTGAIDESDPRVRQQARRPVGERYLFICVAIRELEAWFLADGAAISAILPKVSFMAPADTGAPNAERTLVGLWRQEYGRTVAFNKKDFAKRIAPKLKPTKLNSIPFRLPISGTE